MIPHNLDSEWLSLADSRYSIVIITGNRLRHQRFAYRLQHEFRERVVGWFQISNTPPKSGARSTEKGSVRTRFKKAFKLVPKTVSKEKIKDHVERLGLFGFISQVFDFGVDFSKCAWRMYRDRNKLRQAELKLFGPEIEDLKEHAVVGPTEIVSPNDKDTIDQIKRMEPFFIVSLGGPLLKKELLYCARGVAINQHAGWSPIMKGSNTSDWAIYHRNLDLLGSTVHITATGADSGAILRRSNPCILADDTPESCFCRVVALGTELIVDVIHEIIEKQGIMKYKQDPVTGKTYLGSHLTPFIRNSIATDFANGWLTKELARLRTF